MTRPYEDETHSVRNLMEYLYIWNWLNHWEIRIGGQTEKSGWKSVRPNTWTVKIKKKKKIKCVPSWRIGCTHEILSRVDLTRFHSVGWRFSLRFFFFYLSTWLTRYLAHDSLPFRLPADISNNPSPQKKIKIKRNFHGSPFVVSRLRKISFWKLLRNWNERHLSSCHFPANPTAPMRVNKDKPQSSQPPSPTLPPLVHYQKIYTHAQEELLWETNVKAKTR